MELLMAGKTLIIGNNQLTFKEIDTFFSSDQKIVLTDEVKEKIQISRSIIEEILQSDRTIYGVNTGFGKFSEMEFNIYQSNHLHQSEPVYIII